MVVVDPTTGSPTGAPTGGGAYTGMLPGVVMSGELDVLGALDDGGAGFVVVPCATGTTGSVGEPVVSTRLCAWC